MNNYSVQFPIIRGYQYFLVEADNEEEAIEKVLGGETGDSDFEGIEVDFDSNLAKVEQLD